jgi:NodT family efflux transporter outer membrane factor (OMF) lipoprotein
VNSGDAGVDSPSAYSANLGASWEVDLWGARLARQRADDETISATRETLRDIQVSLVAETAQAYAELRTAQLRLEVTRDNLAIQQQTLQFVQWQQQVGLSTELAVSQARANQERSRAQIPESINAINQSINRLQVLTGDSSVSLRQQLIEPRALPAMPTQLSIGIPADTLRQRPDVRNREFLLRAQAARLAGARAERLPALRLTGSLGVNRPDIAELFDPSFFTRSLLASLAYTLFDGGTRQRNVQIRDLELERALLDYETTLREALEEAENALSALDSSQQQRLALTAAEQSASLAAELATLQYESGLVDFQTVLDTQQTLLDTQNAVAGNQGAIMSNLIRLYRSLGGGWQKTGHRQD